jgi:hypothetical protein
MTPDFLKNVYLLSAISSVTFGLIVALVVARRIGYLAGAISHCAFGGIGAIRRDRKTAARRRPQIGKLARSSRFDILYIINDTFRLF